MKNEELRKLKSMIKLGFNKYQIAQYFNCSWNKIDKEILKYDLPKPKSKGKLTDFQLEQVMISYEQCRGNFTKMAKNLKVSLPTAINRYKAAKEKERLSKEQQKWLTKNANFAEEN